MVKTIPFPFISKRDIEEIFDINFYAPTLLSKYLIKAKRMPKGASIVFLSSIDGPVTAHHANSIYAASKGAVSAMAKSMAMDLVSKKIRVNCVLPGMTETPLIHGEAFTEDDLEKDKSQYPLKRYGRPEEIAWAIIYFLSDASGFTTAPALLSMAVYGFIGYGDTEIYRCGDSFGLSLCPKKDCAEFRTG